MDDGHIRDAAPDRDAAACLEIYAPFIAHTHVSFEERVPTVEQFGARMRDQAATHPWLVLESGGELVGFAYASAHRERSAYRWAADVAIYVTAGRRRAGAGRALYAELLDRLRRQRFQVACAGVALPNDASIALHLAMGFSPIGVYRRIGWKFGSWHDVAWYQLSLQRAAAGPPPEPLPPGFHTAPTR